MAGDHDRSARLPGRSRTSPNPLAAAIDRLRRDPALFVPFLVVGLVLASVDWLRRRDPIPVIERPGFGTDGINIQVEFVGYPTAVRRTTLPLESLIGLELPSLFWGIALYVLPLVAISAAGAVTMARAMGRTVRLEGVVSLFGFVVAIDLGQRLLGSIELLQEMGLWGLVPLACYFLVMVRLFAVPGLLVAGSGLWPAIRESARRSRGRGWTVFGVILFVGISAWLLANLSFGTVLSAVVAPVHAVAIVAFLDLAGVGD